MERLVNRFLPTLGGKITVVVALALIAAGSVFVYFAQKTGHEMLIEQGEEEARDVAEFGKAMLEMVMLSGRPDQLRGTLKSAAEARNITDVFILRSDGGICFRATDDSSTPPRSVLDALAASSISDRSFLTVEENGKEYGYIMTPIANRTSCAGCHQQTTAMLGYYAVKLSVDELHLTVRGHRVTNILMSVITFTGLGAVIVIAVFFLVVQPVTKLRHQILGVEQQLQKLEQGGQVEFTQLEMPRTKDEIAGLIGAFNTLIRRLNEAHRRLHEMHQTQLSQADRLASVGEMAASIAHEIKNPIAGVLGAVQIFHGDLRDDDPRREILTEMMVQLERMNHAVNDLLSYARPAPPVFEDADIRDILDRTLALFKPQIARQQITVHLNHGESIPRIRADRKLLQQMLWNIILNGCQAIESPGTLIITTEAEDSSVTITITDSGKGIAPEHMDRIFTPFFTTKAKGTGLGLAICKRIIDQHNGTMTIDSVSGSGTTVTVRLPVHGGSISP